MLFSWRCASVSPMLRMFNGNWLGILPFAAGAREWRVGSHRRTPASHPMNLKLRLYGFLAVVLLAALVGWAGNSAWQQLKQLRKNFGSVRSESFHLAPAERAALNEFVEDCHAALGGLQRLRIALVALVLIFGFTATSLIY